MTITEMISLFDLIQDKVDTVYYTDSEKVEFLNAAQRMLVQSIVFNPVNPVDKDKKIDSIISTLIERDVEVEDWAGDNPTKTEIDAEVSTVVLYILSATRELSAADPATPIVATWVRENEVKPFNENTFKAASSSNPWVQMDKGGLKFTPTPVANTTRGTTKTILNVVREPVDMATPSANCELPESIHENIIARALALAGIASGDEALLMLSQITAQ